MTRWIAAAVAIVAAGIGGAILVPSADAQDSKPAREPAKISSPGEYRSIPTMPVPKQPGGRIELPVPNMPAERITEREAAERGLELTPAQREALRAARAEGREGFVELTQLQARPATRNFVYQVAGHGQPGTWQIVTHKDMVLLLNTASGDTFRLGEDGIGGVKWEPIPRPEPPRRDALLHRFFPDPPVLPWGRAEKDVRREGEKRGDERRWDDEKLADFEKAVDRIENELEEIAKKLNDAGPDERAKLRDRRRELEKKLDELDRELKDMRRGR